MSYINSILNDLREKRLWPIALVLLAALVAVPVLLSSSAKPAPVAKAAPPTPPPSAATALPAVSISSEPAHSRLKGKGRDPFTQMLAHATAATTAATPSATTTTASSTSATSGSSQASPAPSTSTTSPTSTSSQPTAGGGGSTSGGSTPTAPTGTGTSGTHVTYFYFATDLAFWRAGTNKRVYRNAARFRAFPSTKNPLLVFLGVKNDARTAVFLVSPLAGPTGPGKCLPSARHCTFLDLKVGQRERIVATNRNQEIVHYRLIVKAVRMVPARSPKAAKAATARASAAGHKIAAAARRSSPLLPWPTRLTTSGLISATVRAAAEHHVEAANMPAVQPLRGRR
jgi:hypothetical protein